MVIGSNEYWEEYVKDLVNDWNNQLVLLSSITESQPHVAYSAFVSDFKLNYFMRKLLGASQFLYALEETVSKKFISAITGSHIYSNMEWKLSLPTPYSGLAIPLFYELSETESENLHKITSQLTSLIINQSSQYNIDTVSSPLFCRGAWKIFNVDKKGGLALFEFLGGLSKKGGVDFFRGSSEGFCK